MMQPAKIMALGLFAALLIAASDQPNSQAGGPASTAATEVEHLVASGETLSGIANRAGVAMAAIAAANGLSEPYIVKSGQTLVIPRQIIHTIEAGDTGFGIALRYGVPFTNIAIANQLKKPHILRIGQKLIIPAMVRQPLAKAGRSNDPAGNKPYFRYPHDGAILLGFTQRPDGGGHDGMDFAAKAGDMVRAASSGTVIFAGDEPSRFGRMVVIDHGHGWHSAYGHLARITANKGDVVKSGERVGIAGDAGGADQIELHFEIRRGHAPLDPAKFLPKRRP